MPGLLARIFFIQFQIKKQIQKYLHFDRHCSTSLQNVSVNQLGFVHYLSLLLLAFFSLVMIVLVTVVQKDGVGDFRSRAWSGITYNAQQLQLLTGFKKKEPGPFVYKKDSPSPVKTMFHQLTKTYFDADVQNIDIPSVNVKGVAFLTYDQDLKKTFIFSRIENLPMPENRIVRFWIKNTQGTYTPVGIGSFYVEQNKNVAYSVYAASEDLRVNDSLIVSYDSDIDTALPQVVILQLKF